MPGCFSTKLDLDILQNELSSFIPDRLFDAHAHLWHENYMNFPAKFSPVCGCSDYLKAMECLFPRRQVSALYIPFPCPDTMIGHANEWIDKQQKMLEGFRGLYLINPKDDPERVRDEVKRLNLQGLKCYHTYANCENTMEAEIPDYLPESFVKVANDEEWVITVHLVRKRSVADPSNQHWIRYYCEKYPKMRMILAHSARGFQPANNLEGLQHLMGLKNIYFDTSANCEPFAHQCLMSMFGPKRILFGTDFPISHFRGKSVGIGDSFVWLLQEDPTWSAGLQGVNVLLVGIENLRSLKWACFIEGWSDHDVEDLFWNNACELFGL